MCLKGRWVGVPDGEMGVCLIWGGGRVPDERWACA